MKHHFPAAVFAVLALLLVLSACDRSPAALNVNDVKSDPGAYKGELHIAGVMAAVAESDAQIFGIMDITELQCTTPDCHKFLLPVRYAGKVPAMGDEVVVSGEFIQGGQIFAATDVKVRRNHKL